MNLYSLKTLTEGGAIAFIVGGILCLLTGIGIIFLYRWKQKRFSKDKKESFNTTNRRFGHQIFNFWTNYLYFFLIFLAFLMGIIFIPIGVGYFV